jgi:tetratricopeptide (TPR) repeat protein
MERTLGPHHPGVAGMLSNLGLTLGYQGKLEEAEATHRRAIDAAMEAFGPEHPFVAGARTHLGVLLVDMGRYVEAEAEHRAALELRVRTRGVDHPLVAASHNNIALALAGQKRWEEAVAEYRAAIAAMLGVMERDHPDVALMRLNLALALSHESPPDAELELRSALPVIEKAFGSSHHYVALARRELAELLLGRGQAGPEALELAEQAWAAHSASTVAADERALTSFALAKVLWAVGGDRTRARSLAQQARRAYMDAGANWKEDADEIAAWLRER